MTISQEIAQLKRRKRPRTITTNVRDGSRRTNLQTRKPHRKAQKSFKLMTGRDGTTAFLPLDSRIGGQGQNRDSYPTVCQYLTREQAS